MKTYEMDRRNVLFAYDVIRHTIFDMIIPNPDQAWHSPP